MRRSVLAVSSLVALGGAAWAAAVPHPSRADRLVDSRDGLRIEYSAGQEAIAEATFRSLTAWRAELAALRAKLPQQGLVALPCNAADFREHRTEILRQVAKEIGLPRPTELQGRTFDAMLDYYEMHACLTEMLSAISLQTAECGEVQIWNRDELTRRLGAGEKIDGFTYDAATNAGMFSFSSEIDPIPVGEQEAVREKFEKRQLNHSFSYRTGADGVADLAASITFNTGEKIRPLQPAERGSVWLDRVVEGRRRIARQKPTALPIVLSAKNAEKTPAQHADELVGIVRGFVAQTEEFARYRNPSLAYVILHEVAEVGIVENYIGSADRRWLCDGTANYVAWKVLRDRAGAAFAQQAYDLDAQLAQYAALQPQIQLRHWSAVENTKEDERETPLNKAHYAFATRVLFEFVRQHGEAAVPKLFQEVARTPRRKVTMATVEKAYRKVTGRPLDDLLKAAETAPIAVARTASKTDEAGPR